MVWSAHSLNSEDLQNRQFHNKSSQIFLDSQTDSQSENQIHLQGGSFRVRSGKVSNRDRVEEVEIDRSLANRNSNFFATDFSSWDEQLGRKKEIHSSYRGLSYTVGLLILDFR